ncbi:YggL family protein [Thiopseudomonas denitrificans]|uniref:DUF469 domain-containing protein n=1 Tax=Thiopseudomonas denitrificans TaxID=1501432 RepID=A0A4R6U5P9_9GAMM|nr:50S ribosome-binding protein YggL [Thiopseudomonas denitrificans]TDQ40173.1 hypothetical protein DFQ45_101308 [Thiopseudomonas denitrificans]
MAKNRSRRLRKKLCVDEFQELGFEVQVAYPESLSDEAIEAFYSDFIVEAIERNGLGLIGGPEYALVCLGARGSVTPEQRSAVESWLKGRSEPASVEISELQDAWYPETPVRQQA